MTTTLGDSTLCRDVYLALYLKAAFAESPKQVFLDVISWAAAQIIHKEEYEMSVLFGVQRRGLAKLQSIAKAAEARNVEKNNERFQGRWQ